MAEFDTCVEYVLGHEGGLTKNKNDPGGCTNFGISLRFLRTCPAKTLKLAGIFGDVAEQTIVDLTIDQAHKIYLLEFWEKAPFDKIMNGIIGQYIFDMSVHHGLSQAVKIAQRACCAAQKKKDYVIDDGIMGARTVSALNQASFMAIPALIAAREGFLRQLVAVNPKLSCFIDGWLVRAYDVTL